jgi:hypothetical protein
MHSRSVLSCNIHRDPASAASAQAEAILKKQIVERSREECVKRRRSLAEAEAAKKQKH